ncbi:MAG: hypothetical protein QXU20_03615 [Candidatus Woesearchaeota archaeon]
MSKNKKIKIILIILIIIILSCSLFIIKNKIRNKKTTSNNLDYIIKNKEVEYKITNDENLVENSSLNYTQNKDLELIELINLISQNIIKYVNNSILDNCSIIGGYTYNQELNIYEPTSYGIGYYVLYDFSEIYKKTREDYYLRIAENQKQCIEKLWPQNFDNERILVLSTILWAESSYYLATNQSPNQKTILLAEYVLKKDSNETNFNLYAQHMLRKTWALANYYELTKREEFYEKAKKIMLDLEQKKQNNNISEYVKAEFLRGFCELYRVKKEKETLDFINKNFEILLNFKNHDGSFGTKEIDKTLVTYQALNALDSCYEATKQQEYLELIINSLEFLSKNLDEKQFGIIELKNKKSISLNTEILKVIIKLRESLKEKMENQN